MECLWTTSPGIAVPGDCSLLGVVGAASLSGKERGEVRRAEQERKDKKK